MTISTHAAAAKAIRTELKARGIKGQVRAKSYSGGSSVNVEVKGLAPATANSLEAFCGQFEMGHFDGMVDMYEYSNRRDDLPQVKFVFVQNKMSDTMRARVWRFCRSYYAGPNNLPESYEDARNTRIDEMNCYPDMLVSRVFSDADSRFWQKGSMWNRIAA